MAQALASVTGIPFAIQKAAADRTQFAVRPLSDAILANQQATADRFQPPRAHPPRHHHPRRGLDPAAQLNPPAPLPRAQPCPHMRTERELVRRLRDLGRADGSRDHDGERHVRPGPRPHAVLLREALGDAPAPALLRSPGTVCVAAEGHLLAAEEPGRIRPDWKPWRFEALPIVLDAIPVQCGTNRSGQSHAGKIAAIGQALKGVERVIIATDPGREGSMIAWEVLEHLGWRGRVDRLKLGALDDVSIRRAFATLAREPDSGARDYAAYLEALCRQYEDYHLGLNGTRAISLRLRPPAFREPWRFGGVQSPTLALLADWRTASGPSCSRTSTRWRCTPRRARAPP